MSRVQSFSVEQTISNASCLRKCTWRYASTWQTTGVRLHALWVAEAFSCPWARLMEVALGNGRRSFLGVDVIENEKRTVDMGWCSPQMGWVEQTWGCGCTEKVVPMQEPCTSRCSRQPVLVCLEDLRNHGRVWLCRRHDNSCSCQITIQRRYYRE